MTRSRSDQGGGCDAPRPLWHHLAPRFTGDRECLAAYLALEAAEVLGGAKPANLINLVDRERHCGRNLYRLWRRHGQTLLAEAGAMALRLACCSTPFECLSLQRLDGQRFSAPLR